MTVPRTVALEPVSEGKGCLFYPTSPAIGSLRDLVAWLCFLLKMLISFKRTRYIPRQLGGPTLANIQPEDIP